MRSTRFAIQRVRSPSTSNTTAFTQPVPTSIPAVMVMAVSSLAPGRLRDGPAGEGGRPERAGVDRLGVDVDGDVAVVLLHELPELAHGGLVLGDAAGEGEL